MRTAEIHETQCNLVSTARDSAFHSTTYGINFNSPLNKLAYYHAVNYGLPPDPMHDLLEGYTNRQLNFYYLRLSMIKTALILIL